MKRRDFLKSTVAVGAVAALPAAIDSEDKQQDSINWGHMPPGAVAGQVDLQAALEAKLMDRIIDPPFYAS